MKERDGRSKSERKSNRRITSGNPCYLVGNPQFFLVCLQEIPVVENHIILKEQKSFSTSVAFKHFGQVPVQLLANVSILRLVQIFDQ